MTTNVSSSAASLVKIAAARIGSNVERVIVGKGGIVELAIVALLSEGHILLDDVPGVGKTTLAKALARSIGGTFRRVQCTPDLLPSDLTGVSVYDAHTSSFEYRAGPVHANVVLADEINRATPRTQSALLESMDERQVTVDGVTRPLPRPFLVIATQNPVEFEGTFPLPEAQLDRFLMRLRIGYPDESDEEQMLQRFEHDSPLESLDSVTTSDELLHLQGVCRQVHAAADVRQYVVQLVRNSRAHSAVELGASPRATLALYRSAQSLAAVRGRQFLMPDDVKVLAPLVLAHRLVLTPQARVRGRTADSLIHEVLERTPVPVEQINRP